jgi:hypothetical protein
MNDKYIEKDTAEAISAGISYLNKAQKKDGSFSNLVSPSENFDDCEENESSFPTILSLHCLRKLPDSEEIKTIKDKASKFVLSQHSDFWSWNYWKRNSLESTKTPYPEDLDDTCCALAALIENQPETVPTDAVAKAVNLLTYSESQEGGPYYTWITPPDADKGWKDIDLAVNSNIGFFLSLQEVNLPSITKLIEKAIDEEKYDSPYYFSPVATIYFISRWYKRKGKSKIITFLLERMQEDHSWGNPLETALAVISLINFGYEKEKIAESIGYILKHQEEDKWKEYPFVVEFIKKNTKHYAGSPELTTAFCLEALHAYSSKCESESRKRKVSDSQQRKMREKIMELSDLRFAEFDNELRKDLTETRSKILKGDSTGQIILLPYYLEKSLNGNVVNEDLISRLGVAGLYGWMAYTVYDDFLDNEGDPKLLPAANVCLRELTSIYAKNFSNDEKFMDFFEKIMDRIDSANAWETKNCRMRVEGDRVSILEKLPDYGKLEKLADRSIGHALGAAAVLYSHTKETESSEMENLMSFFENYIIARQLNDDAHDWEKDLKNGQISPAVVSVLKRYSKSNASKGKELDLKKQLEQLRKIFWYDVIHEICDKALFHVREAEKDLENIKVIKDKAIFKGMLEAVKKSASEAITEQKEMLTFMKEYE